ncbi:sigma-70 family RNA polymerase sigma factor [Oscillibacter ruminantium]|uniref:sigma-70 family RNA polymerase sigma factor n=1 Tax=Oscillibacter ruminantium TaxID=1263547 RepID=UPI0003138BD4|nr:sigma-70 family RNA polymerase sigma factor [Oscillibacter ruminantium]MDN0032658.1 sigma-70 family RNA polymerase sigma factor [Oscillibacter valericigenes]
MVISQVEYARRVQAGRGQFYRIAYCYVKNTQDALDIVSEAIYKGLSSLHQLKQADYFDTWMTRIVINAALTHLRKAVNQPANKGELPEDIRVDEAALSVEASLDLYEALELLEPSERSLVILHYFEDRPFREMAEILDLPEPTVKSRLYRVLKKLKAQLSA